MPGEQHPASSLSQGLFSFKKPPFRRHSRPPLHQKKKRMPGNTSRTLASLCTVLFYFSSAVKFTKNVSPVESSSKASI